jgi:hypothetical protein
LQLVAVDPFFISSTLGEGPADCDLFRTLDRGLAAVG